MTVKIQVFCQWFDRRSVVVHGSEFGSSEYEIHFISTPNSERHTPNGLPDID